MKIDVKHQIDDQFTGVHFPDINPCSYDIGILKFGLNVSAKVKFIVNDDSL